MENETTQDITDIMDVRRVLMRVLVIALGCLYLFWPGVTSEPQQVMNTNSPPQSDQKPWWENPLALVVLTAILTALFLEIFKWAFGKWRNYVKGNEFNRVIWWAFALRIERMLMSLTLIQRGKRTQGLLEEGTIRNIMLHAIKNDRNTYRKYAYMRMHEIIHIVSNKMKTEPKSVVYAVFINEYKTDLLSKISWTRKILKKDNIATKIFRLWSDSNRDKIIEKQMKIVYAYHNIIVNMGFLSPPNVQSTPITSIKLSNYDSIIDKRDLGKFKEAADEIEEMFKKARPGAEKLHVIALKNIILSYSEIKKCKLYIDEREVANVQMKDVIDELESSMPGIVIYE